MRKIQILGAFVAVLAFSALAVASASATLWLNGEGLSMNEETSSTTRGTIKLEHLGNVITCTGTFIGTVGGPEEIHGVALDLVTLVEGLKGEKDLINCTETTVGGLFKCANLNALVLVEPVHLPWHTLLELVTGGTVDHFLATNAGYTARCPLAGNITCEGLELSLFTKNGASGAEFTFSKLEKSKCSDLGEGTLTGEGTVLGFTVS